MCLSSGFVDACGPLQRQHRLPARSFFVFFQPYILQLSSWMQRYPLPTSKACRQCPKYILFSAATDMNSIHHFISRFASSSSSSRPYPLLHIISIFRHCARSHMFPCIRNGPPPPHELFAVSVKLIIRAGLLHIAVMRCVTDGGGPSLLSSWGGQESWPSASSPSN